MRKMKSGGGWKAIGYSLRLMKRVGFLNMWRAMRSKNTCKTCAVGMGGQLGGMVNEGGHFPEVCKKSFQAMASDLQGAVPDSFFETMTLPKLRAMSPRELEHAGRLVRPMILREGDDRYRPIEWDEALKRTAESLRTAGPERSFFYASGRSSNEAGFLLQLMARLHGTNYVNNCSYYCHQASGVGLGSSIGTGAGTVQLDDLENTDLYILIGANPASNHPRLMRSLMGIRRKGGNIIVINPVKELGLVNFRVPSDVRSLLFGSKIASQYVQPHVGGDLALLSGIAKFLLEQGADNRSFIDAHTEGFTDFRAELDRMSWDQIVETSGVDRETIEKIGTAYQSAENPVIGWAMGITHHIGGTNNVRAIANLALLRGAVGRRGAGLMPIRGHSNVQGMGSVGVTPTLKKAIIERFEQRLGLTPPASPGYDTMACMKAADRGEMDTAICLGGNLYGSNPASEFASRALAKVGLIVQMSTTLNTGHAHGIGRETILLPVLPRDEEPQPTTQESMFSYVRYSEGGKARFEGPRSEVSILAEIGRGIFGDDGPVDWTELQSHQAIRELIADLIPAYASLSKIDETKDEFHVPGRAVSEYRFPTPNGKAKFHALPLPENSPFAHRSESNGTAESPELFRLMTIRSEGQFNTVVYDEEDIYRHVERRDVILLNEADIERLGLRIDQPVRVTGPEGEMRQIRVRAFDVRAGSALMYYPESNVLIPTDVDEFSKTPGFKGVPISITPDDPIGEPVALETNGAVTR